MSKKIKNRITVFFLSLQIIFALFLPLQPLINLAQAAENQTLVFSKNQSSIIVSNSQASKFSYFFRVNGSNFQSIGTIENGSFLIDLKSESGEDELPFAVERLVLKTDLNSYFLEIVGNEVNVVKESKSDSLELDAEEENFLLNVWQIDAASRKATTNSSVVLNQEYRFPLNEDVRVTFTKLPVVASALSIQEVTLTTEQQQALGATSNVAFDINTEMANGEFAFDLELPVSETESKKELEVKFAENQAGLTNAQTVSNVLELGEQQVRVKNLEHMTIFVVTTPDPVSNDCSDAGFSVSSGDKCFNTIADAVAGSVDGDIINILAGTYNEGPQIVIDKNLTIIGENKLTTTIKPSGNTGSSGDARGWFLIRAGYSLTLQDVTLDGNGYNIMQAVRSWGSVNVNNSVIKNISFPSYNGIGVAVMGNSDSQVLDSTFENIGRIGTIIYGTGVKALIKGNTYVGKGDGDWLDYGVEVGGGGEATIENNEIANCVGVASVDGSVSAAVLATDYYGGGTSIALSGNNFHDSSYGVALGYGSDDATVVTQLTGNTFNNNDYDLDNYTANDIDARNNTWSVTDQTDLDQIEAKIGHYCSGSTYVHGICSVTDDYGAGFGIVRYKDIEVPENLGWNVSSKTSDPGVVPVTIACGGYTNDNTPSHVWASVKGVNIKYQRQAKPPTGSWWPDPAGYTNTNTAFVWFGNPTNGIEGEWNSRVRSYVDLNNNNIPDSDEETSGWSDECKITYDRTNPSIPVLTWPINGLFTNNNRPLMQWDDSSDGLGIYGYFYRVHYHCSDADNSSTCTSVYPNSDGLYLGTSQYQAGPTSDGVYYWQVKAQDLAGNQSDWSDMEKVTIDTVAPGIPTLASPNDGYMTRGIAFTQKWDAIGDAVLYEYQSCNADPGDDGAPCSSVKYRQTYTGTVKQVEAGQPSSHFWWRVRAKDAAGNWSNWSESRELIIDTVAPTVTVNTLLINDKTPLLSGTWNDDNGQLNSIEITVDGQVNTATINPDGTWILADNVLSALSDGIYDVQVKATDKAGNVGNDTAENELQIDSVAPTAQYTHYIDGVIFGGIKAYVKNINQLRFSGTYDDALPSSGLFKDSFVIFQAQNDGSFRFSQNGKLAYCGWRNPANTLPISGGVLNDVAFANCKSDLGEGEYYLAHQVYDNAIRWDIPSINQFRDVLGLHFVIDQTPPTSTISIPTDDSKILVTNDWDGYIAGTANDTSSGINRVELEIVHDSDAPVIATASGSLDGFGQFNWDYTLPDSPEEGTYTITSHAIDNAGNRESSYTITVIIDKTIPKVDLSISPDPADGKNGWYSTQPTITLTATDMNFDHIEYQWDGKNDGSWTNSASPVSFQPASEGHHILYYRAIDKAGNGFEDKDIGVKNIFWDQTELTEGPLKVEATPERSGGPDAKVTWEAATDNVGIDHYRITFDLLDGDADFSKDVASNVRELETDKLTEAGTWKITVTAFDGAGHEKSASDEIIVDKEAPAAPALSLDGTGLGSVDLSWTKIDDADEYIILYGVNDGQYIYAARVGDVTSYTVQGLTAGNYYFVVRAEDSSGNQSANSNQVSTLSLLAAPGGGGPVAEGFAEAPEILGENTKSSSAKTEEQPTGEVLGVTSCNPWLNSLWWILLLVQFIGLFVLEYFLSKKYAWLKFTSYILLGLASTVLVHYLVNIDCLSGGFVTWSVRYYFLTATATLILAKVMSYLLIEREE